MNSSDERIERLKELIIDPEFASVCPPLTDDESAQLEENILSDGEVTDPLVVWNNVLIDGHHRRKILLKHLELPFTIRDILFNNRYEAIVWICKNQAGRRNLTSEQLSYLIGIRNEAVKHSWGASDGFRGNGKTDLVCSQNDNIVKPERTCERLAKEYGVSSSTILRYARFAKGVDAAEAACPGVKHELLSGSLKATQQEISDLAKLSPDEIAEKIAGFRKAQEERDANRRKPREEKRRKENEAEVKEKTYRSVSESGPSMSKNKPCNNVANVLGIVIGKVQEFQGICDSYFDEVPECQETVIPQLLTALDELKVYLKNITYKKIEISS